MPSFNSVAGFQSVLQRKPLSGVVLMADHATTFLSDICTTGGDLDIPTGYETLGKISNDGVSFGGDVSKQEDRHFGDISASRVDVESEEITLGWSAAETNRAVLEAFHSVDLADVAPDSSTGTVTFDKPPLPALIEKRVVALFRDVNKNNGLPIYLGLAFPRGSTSRDGEQTWAKEEGGLVYPMTSSGLLDEAEGTACRLFMGGAGLSGIVEQMGFKASAA